MTTLLTPQPTPEWVLTLRTLDHPPATPAVSQPHACSPETDEEGLAILLTGIVRGLLRRSPLEANLEQSEPSSLCFL
ncbi:MAG: hypothetical protein A2Z66_09485 [Chloroflexi bacterium RBG_13_66_10]|nr:MAG: hypothetical protein A2Z66_09485 [Chloroflexi bacterium RBG_13_66_10]